MSKREPLLGDPYHRLQEKYQYYGGPSLPAMSGHAVSTMAAAAWSDGFMEARDFYERLIDEGRLRVVEEVEFVDNDYDANVDCNRCGWSICYIHIEDNPMTFCPGCGSSIKR